MGGQSTSCHVDKRTGSTRQGGLLLCAFLQNIRWKEAAQQLFAAPVAFKRDTQVLAHTGSGPGREACFDENGDRNLMALLAASLLCSAGQPFAHQFDMHGILLSSKDAWSWEDWIIH